MGAGSMTVHRHYLLPHRHCCWCPRRGRPGEIGRGRQRARQHRHHWLPLQQHRYQQWRQRWQQRAERRWVCGAWRCREWDDSPAPQTPPNHSVSPPPVHPQLAWARCCSRRDSTNSQHLDCHHHCQSQRTAMTPWTHVWGTMPVSWCGSWCGRVRGQVAGEWGTTPNGPPPSCCRVAVSTPAPCWGYLLRWRHHCPGWDCQ